MVPGTQEQDRLQPAPPGRPQAPQARHHPRPDPPRLEPHHRPRRGTQEDARLLPERALTVPVRHSAPERDQETRFFRLGLLESGFRFGILGNMDYIQRIRQLIALRGMSHKDLGERIGLKKTTMSRLLSGKQEPKLREAYDLARELGVTLDDLMGDEPPGSRCRRRDNWSGSRRMTSACSRWRTRWASMWRSPVWSMPPTRPPVPDPNPHGDR